ncbi:TadE/TadG family type IV pilus assembly protein [Lachnoclostridium phytofermentans]|uniref:TadE family protein n=1 Tax=Lachnoclostridium phytofermentans (strain ATCC 700394 / DSM 18823 / ISDg) TaxID=357809 RepID=A9KQC0_LACP7|nr:TadE family protein [Lachnoclostridium phytofermentans]ABX40429.1 hypothetical protein Cphy_0039 [Lachnoclostridium phytofermentans ISDg]
MIKKAFFTVEAAFVLPLVFYTILFLLNYSFYSHDRTKLQALGEEVALKAASYISYQVDMDWTVLREEDYLSKSILYPFGVGREKDERKVLSYVNETLTNGYWVCEIRDLQVQTTLSKVKITGKLKAVFPSAKLFGILKKDSFTVPFCFEESIFSREEKTRLFEVSINLGKKIKGVDKAVQKLKELVGKMK